VPSYKLEILIKGKDMASGAIRGVSNSLSGLGKITLAGLGAGLAAVGVGVGALGVSAVKSASQIQDLKIALDTLVAREISRGDLIEETTKKTLHLTDEEKAKLAELRAEYNLLSARTQEQKQRVWEMTNVWTEQGLATKTARAELAKMELRLSKLNGEIEKLASKEGKVVTVTNRVRVNTMSLGEAMKEAAPKAAELMRRLRDVSLISPFEYEQVANTFRFNMAMGATSDQAMDLTRALLDTGAALGLDNEMFNRLNYNLAQAVISGDFTAANLRQLRMVGLDLADVFQSELGLSIKEVNKQWKAGKLTAADLTKAFSDFASKNFGGAAEKMSKTLRGLKSSFKDLIFFAGADIALPGVEVITERLGDLFDRVRGFLEGGAFARLGQQIADALSFLLSGDFEGLAEALGIGPEFQTLIENVLSMFAEVVSFLRDNLGAALTWVREDGLGLLGQAIAFVNEHWDTFKAAILGVGAALTAAGIAGALLTIVGAINPVTLAIGALGAAVGLLVQAWNTDWMGMRTTITEFWETTARPALTQLGAWLGENVPKAMAALATFWATTLQPALQTLGAFLTESVIPVIVSLAQWLGENLPLAMEAIANFVTGTLVPALKVIWSNIEEYGLPLVTALGNVMRAVLGKALEFLVALWNSKLKPFFKDLFAKIKEANDKFGILQGVLNGIKQAFQAIGKAIKKVIDWLKELVKKINQVQIPSWLEGDSPPPMANWFSDIGRAMHGASMNFGTFQQQLGGGFGAAAAPVSQAVSVGGDVIHMYVSDAATASLVVAMMEERRQARLNAFMGVV